MGKNTSLLVLLTLLELSLNLFFKRVFQDGYASAGQGIR